LSDNRNTIIVGGGVTGISAGYVSGLKVYESRVIPGGICSSYYINPDLQKVEYDSPEDEQSYRFEIGGGHWIFGGDPVVIEFIRRFSSFRQYIRKSAVYFSKKDLYVPYPIQNNLYYLGKDIARKAIREMTNRPESTPSTLEEWLEINFGKTLLELFFAPFHEMYTAGLWTSIAPQDPYKSPVNISAAVKGAEGRNNSEVGYNTTYLYPEKGLNSLISGISASCDISYGHRAVKIDTDKNEVMFENGNGCKYRNLISTAPLNFALEMAGIEIDEDPPEYTSVLVLNIGAVKGGRCPEHHWLYIPDSDSGFHRVGFYSNVDDSFLPFDSRKDNEKVSIYVETAYRNGEKPSDEEINHYTASVLNELKKWGFIDTVETVDPTWIDVAYTWSQPGSNWRNTALNELQKRNIYQIGRYGRWVFQGIADSIKDGLFAGGAMG